MTTDVKALVPQGISHTDPEQTRLVGMTTDERMKYHAKRIQAIGFTDGTNGVKRYKDKHPEAAGIMFDLRSIAYRPKPRGYANYIAGMVEGWLDTKTSVFESNRADVERLNSHFETTRFNPNNHFSRPIPMRLRERLKGIFAKKGMPLDIAKVDTLSKVREAAKAAKGYESSSRRFGTIGVISGKVLTLGTRTFTIDEHNGHECVRLSINGKRVRLRLDGLEQVIEALAGMPETGNDPLYTTIPSIGELAPEPKKPGFEGSDSAENGELAPKPWACPGLGARGAALRSVEGSHSTTFPDDVDPLTILPIDR